MTLLKNGGWHSGGEYLRIEETAYDPSGRPIAQLVTNFVSIADHDADAADYQIWRRDGGVSIYAHKSSARRAWRRILSAGK